MARLGVLAGTVVLAGCTSAPTPTPEPSPTAVTPSAPTCSPEGIRITALEVEAAMGLRAMGVELVNCGTGPYALEGHPVPRLWNADRDPLTVQVIPGARSITSGFDQPPRPIELRPGERATAALLWRNLVTDSSVVASDGAYLEISPVAGRPAVPVDLDGPIDLGNTGQLGVSAWKQAD
ncbi:Protein of unknown function [Micromonospora eburnea]|uniref:DUF4232 domain-containing protein n=2 Tax=Micromonospora eburnea TaxID=227316 RepID=A0A1C6VL92_9ACTN|nr:Protein of unknown function [Micromonospora eburnea]